MAALLGVLIFDTLPGLFIGVAVSFVLLVYRAYRPHLAVMGRSPVTGTFADVDRDPDVEVVPGIVVVRPEAGLFFANAEAVRDGVLAQVERSGATAVVLDAETVPTIDVTAVRMLDALAADLERRGVRMAIARGVGQVRDLLAGAGSGRSQLETYPTVRAAVAALIGSSDPAPPADTDRG